MRLHARHSFARVRGRLTLRSGSGSLDWAQVTDPLGLGVLNQSTFQLEANDESTMGNTRRQLHKLARYQAGAKGDLGSTMPGLAPQARTCRYQNAVCAW